MTCFPFATRKTKHAEEEEEEDPEMVPTHRRMHQVVVTMDADNTLYEDPVLRASDYNVMRRYELYGDEEIERVHAQLTIRHIPGRYIDIYYYEKEKMNEVRYVVTYTQLDSMSFQMDHAKRTSSATLGFDGYKEIVLPECPIQFAIYLSEYLFKGI